MLAWYMLSLCVCLSVTSWHCTKMAKRRFMQQYHAITQRFSDAKDLGEIPMGSPPTGAPKEVGWVQIGDFRPISRCISKTVQDRDIVTMEC